MSRIRLRSAYILLLTGFLLSVLLVVDAKLPPGYPPPGNPFIDPKHDLYNPLRYIPSNVLTAIAVALYLLTSIALTFCMWKWGAKWMLCMVIGGYTMTMGLAMRFGLAKNPHSKGLYIAEYLLVVLSPCAFIAADYILLGRLSAKYNLGAYLYIKPQRITKVFVTSDLCTFLVQALGGGMSISQNNLKVQTTGGHIFLAGLALQLLSFTIFMCLYLYFLIKVRKNEPQLWNGTDPRLKVHGERVRWWNDWRTLASVLIISCIGIFIRSVYRTIENSQGYHGPLTTTEWLFYAFDTLPLFIAVAVYVPFWPGRFLEDKSARKDAESETTPAPSPSSEIEKQ